MTPRPTIATMTCWVAGIGLAAGIALRRSVLPFMARAAGTGIPASFLKVYRTPELIMLATSRRVIATAGSWLPASGMWDSKTRPMSWPGHLRDPLVLVKEAAQEQADPHVRMLSRRPKRLSGCQSPTAQCRG